LKIVADTNVLLRDVLQDDRRQSPLAGKVLQSAEIVALPVAVLCEFVWVLRQGYKMTASEVAIAIRSLIDSWNVVTNRQAVDAGLEFLDNGGDFADGAIAFEGECMGAEEFVSFDAKAVRLMKAQGKRARLLV